MDSNPRVSERFHREGTEEGMKVDRGEISVNARPSPRRLVSWFRFRVLTPISDPPTLADSVARDNLMLCKNSGGFRTVADTDGLLFSVYINAGEGERRVKARRRIAVDKSASRTSNRCSPAEYLNKYPRVGRP